MNVVLESKAVRTLVTGNAIWVLGHKTKDDDVLLTLCERKTRQFFMIKIEDKTSASVMKAFDKLREYYGSKWNQIFKFITTDNGSEFADLSDLEQVSKTLVYYAHPYTSCDKGSVERHNGLIRRYIPKGDLWISTVWKILLRSRYGATLFLGRS
ncbi:hypothetical protein ME792_09260 [Lactobacillus delbrueckii]|nr:hypothetical protein ME792_09260 [Lactobacillus delbrueckii]